jgi:histidine ammonia-lyase
MLHDAPVAAAIDAMSATWAEIAALAHRHVVRLARAGGARLVEPVLAPTEAADEARRLAQPAVLGALELSADPFEDIRSLSPAAYLSHRRVTACLDEVLAALSAACVQAPALHGGTVSSSLAALVAEVRRHAAADSDAWSADRLASLADAITDSIDGGRSLGT